MGDTLPLQRRGHALEGVSRHGRAAPVCRPPARGREDDRAVRGVRDLAEDRIQNLRPLQGLRRRRAQRSQSPTAAPGESAARAGRGADRSLEAGVSRLGRAQDSREAAPAAPGSAALSSDQHGARRPGSPRPGAPARPPASPRGGHRPDAAHRTQCAVVRRLQGRVHAREPALLLSADDHRFRQPLSADL